jgi:tetratricopeptide (TPR) repeat protein
MAEETEQDTGAEASGAGVDPAAVAIALIGASREKADAFLENQSALNAKQGHLVDLQAKELAHELKLRHWSLQVRHVSALLKLALEVSLALIAIALACFVGATVWSAAHADGLIIDAFSVPSDLAAQGLTGEVVASRMLDRLTEMQNATVSSRAPQSYANDWGNDIKVEIPDTGVSFGEAYRYLKGWLGHETHFGGEVVRTDSGLVLTARISGDSNVNSAGTNLDALVEKTAEYVYGQTQPYRYAVYLESHGRTDEALAIFQHLATAGSEEDRPWGYIGWRNMALDSEPPDTTMLMLKRALELQPDNLTALNDLEGDEFNLSHPERGLRDAKQGQSVGRVAQRLIRANQIVIARATNVANIDGVMGDFQKAARERAQPGTGPQLETRALGPFIFDLPRFQTAEHDLAAARASFIIEHARVTYFSQSQNAGYFALMDAATQMLIDSEAQDWTGLVSHANGDAPLFQKFPSLRSWSLTMTVPIAAYASAKLGNIAAAEAEIAPTPGDCYDCLITRARIAEVEGQRARADWWFGRAVDDAPSIPFAYADWGQSMLARGKPDDAIAKFTIANQKGPHFADPLEMWGEALMAKNRSDLALAKFSEAEKYAPNWGRLHMKWGEALGFAGKKDEAQKQFALAAGLDLTAADRAELTKVSHG